jgi:hypothetical protein
MARGGTFSHGTRVGRGDRRRLFDACRIRAPHLAGPVALLHGVGRGIRTAGNSAPWFNNHSYLRLATSFLDFRYRRLIVWYLRKSMPEPPRWLESKRRFAEAEELITKIEDESANPDLPPLPPEASVRAANLNALDLFGAVLLPRLFVGSVGLIVVNTLIFGFVTWLPTFFVHQGLTLTKSFSYTLMISLAAPIGCVLGAFEHIGRRPKIIGGSLLAIVFGALYPNMIQPLLLVPTGFCLLLAIYVLVALLYGVYIPELFPTELRLRANGICNMLGRGATIISPFIVVTLFKGYGVTGVTSFMIGLLVALIVAVWGWGIEPAGPPLESMASTRTKSDFISLTSRCQSAVTFEAEYPAMARTQETQSLRGICPSAQHARRPRPVLTGTAPAVPRAGRHCFSPLLAGCQRCLGTQNLVVVSRPSELYATESGESI